MHFTSIVLASLAALQPVVALGPAAKITTYLQEVITPLHNGLGAATSMIDHAYAGNGHLQAQESADGLALDTLFTAAIDALHAATPENCPQTAYSYFDISKEFTSISAVYTLIAHNSAFSLKGRSGKSIGHEVLSHLQLDTEQYQTIGELLHKKCPNQGATLSRGQQRASNALGLMKGAYGSY